MDKVTEITLEEFLSKYNAEKIDLVEKRLFTKKDFEKLEKLFGYLRGSDRVSHLVRGVLEVVKNPGYFISNIDQIISNQTKDIKKYSKDENKSLKDRYPITDYIAKASVVAAFKPKTVLEIGTYFGWGSAAIKSACPNAHVYTMNPKETADANNPINQNKIGSAFRNKDLEVEQIWADSTSFDYSTLPSIDVTYIDGNHEYDFVYKDLENTSKITTKAIVLDDYIPSKGSPRGDVRAWGPWNESVVNATNDFLQKNVSIFSEVYWIKNTPICILIK